MPVATSLKTYGTIKTYRNAKNNLRKIPNVPVTEASVVFDALFAKNLSKRHLSQSNKNITKKPNTRNTRHRVRELPPPGPTTFNDSLDVQINSTFDNLVQGPKYNAVKYTNRISCILGESSYDTSKSLIKNSNVAANKLRNTRGSKYATRKENNTTRSKNKVQTKGKVQKKKSNIKRKIKTSVIATIENNSNELNVSKKNINISTNHRKSNRKRSNDKNINVPTINALSQPVEQSLIIENMNLMKKQHSLELSKLLREENSKYYKKDLSPNSSTCKLAKPSTSYLTNNSNLRPEYEYENMFHNSLQHFMHAESTPKYLKSSTPVVPKKIGLKLYNSKLENMSPITSQSKMNNLNNPSLSLFSDLNIEINDTKRLTRSKSKNKSPSVVELSSYNNCVSLENRKLRNIPKKNLSREYLLSSMVVTINDSDNLHTNNVTDFKLKQSPVVELSQLKNTLVEKYLRKKPRSTYQTRLTRRITRKLTIEKSFKKQKFTKRRTKKVPEIVDNTQEEINHNARITRGYSKKTAKITLKVTRSTKISAERESQIIRTDLLKWESFSEKHPIIVEAVTENNCDSDIEIISSDSDDENLNNSAIDHVEVSRVPSLRYCRPTLYLKSGKQWRRSLSILKQNICRQAQLPDPNESVHKGRKWRSSVFKILVEQDKLSSVEPKRSIVTNNVAVRNRQSLRSSFRIVKLSNRFKRSTVNSKKSGYVSTVADDSVLESFSKLSLVVAEERDKTAKDIILKRCNQTKPLLFDECYSQRTLKKCRKIGEGVYGEVFMYKNAEDKCVVMKIIPIEGEQLVNGEHQKKFEEIISEIIISTELSNLRTNSNYKTDGFAEVLNVSLVQGKYPQHLIELWDLYDEDRGSENDSPVLFNDDQLYIVLELTNGGQDLEAYHFTTAEQSYSILVQIACSLAVAEAALQFEHRDLHWGNVLISPTDEPTVTFAINGREYEIPTKGVKLTIIDFTLSRMTSDECCIFNDLALDPDLFTATGDYQFEIYRLMKKRNNDDWQKFEPYSNVLWLDYILEKVIKELRYIHIRTKTHKTHIRKLSQIKKKILSFNSVMEFINSDVFSNVFL